MTGITLVDVLDSIRPGAEWVLHGEDYAGLTWLDKTQPKPTANEIQVGLASVQTQKQTRGAAKVQARLDVKNVLLSADQRFAALLTIFDLDL